ncbi:MAG: hypothetical protein E7568_04385 [Ruminococcaceae bacterium]|nr:hypothetical protein [Oscillospiraceae bacterium]
MKIYAPSYYKKFKCIADKCMHNCCIGWEIDIDDLSLEKYKSDKIIADKISFTPTSHFIMGSDGRCPFLNNQNLCEIIKKYGEENLCQICRDHPRFFNFYDTRSEYGLGLVCEAAAKLILDTAFTLNIIGEDDLKETENIFEADFFYEREMLFKKEPYLLKKYIPDIPLYKLADKFLKLERLDAKWDTYLLNIKGRTDSLRDIEIKNAEQWKNLFCYFLYRHFYNTSLSFCLLCTNFIFAIGGDIYEVCRLFSGEIEYSDENIEKVLGFID